MNFNNKKYHVQKIDFVIKKTKALKVTVDSVETWQEKELKDFLTLKIILFLVENESSFTKYFSLENKVS